MVVLAPALASALATLSLTTASETTTLSMETTTDWAFTGPTWSEKAGRIVAPESPRAKDGNVAVYAKHAFTAP